jgi:hypothetical protein
MVVTRSVVWAWAALMNDKASKAAQAEDRILEKKAWVMVAFLKTNSQDYTLKSLHPVLQGPNLHRPAACTLA